MAIPVFPATLPKLVMTNYSYKPTNNLIRTQMETGPAKQRRRFVNVPTEISAEWIFTRAELGIFEKFWKEQLYDGAGWFKLKVVNGAGESECNARFTEPYSASASVREFMWKVNGKVEVMGLPVVPA